MRDVVHDEDRVVGWEQSGEGIYSRVYDPQANPVNRAVPVADDTGHFRFFDDANVELVVKVLDGTWLNGHCCVFYGSLSNVEYTLTVIDTVTGQVRTYTSPSGNFGSVGDTEAFAVP